MLEFRPPAREGDPFDALAAELVRLKVDVIVATGGRAVRATKQATSTIPIVGAPVGDSNFISLSQPSGNVTGSSLMVVDRSGKRLEILQEIVPRASRVAVLWAPPTEPQFRAVQAAGRALGVEILDLQVTQEDAQPHDLDHAFETASRDHADAMLVIGNVRFFGLRARIVDLALRHRLPAIYEARSFAHAGGLVSYGPSDTEYYRRAAVYVDKILKGAKPADLPVEQPVQFELVLNLKTAKALDLTLPPTFLFQADEVLK
jgi:putative ABC transport system substrate-binding protein